MPAKRIRHSKSKISPGAQPVAPAVIKDKSSKLGMGLDNEGFVIDLFLDQQKQVHLTQVLHVKSNDGEAWEGWNAKRLTDFFIGRAQLSVPEPLTEIIEETESVISQDNRIEDIDAELTSKHASPDAEVETKQPEPASLRQYAITESELPAVAAEISQPIVHAVEIVSTYTNRAGRSLARREPFDVQILLEETNLLAMEETDFDYTLLVSAYKSGQNSKYFIAADRGLIKSSDQAIRVNIPRQNLEPGAYRLRAEIAITTQAQPEEGIQPQLISSLNLKSGLLQVI